MSQLVTIDQATDARPYLTARQLRRWIYERRISSWRAGGRVLLDLAELDALVQSTHRPAAS